MRNFVLALLTLTLALPVFATDGVLEINQACAVNTGCFAGDSAGFPVTIDGSAGLSYVLTGSLQVSHQNFTAIQVQTDNVSVDLGGFEIRGITTCSGTPTVCSPTGSGVGVGILFPDEYEGLRVRNGTVTGMGFHGVRARAHALIENVRATQNRAIGINASAGSVIRNCRADTNGADGIATASSVVTGNTSHKNGDDGYSVGGVITGNTATENGGHGMRSTGGVVRGNHSWSNSGFGLWATNVLNGSGYAENSFRLNNGGDANPQVLNGTEIGINFCGTNTTCP